MSAGDLVLRHSDQFRSPLTVGLAVDSGDNLDSLKRTCRDFASFTKDLDGRLSFLLLIPSNELVPAEELDLDWQPLVPRPNRLVLHDSVGFGAGSGPSHIESTGFHIYLSLRAYWEAFGQPRLLRALEPVFDRSGAWMQSAEADNRIDRQFDRHLGTTEFAGSQLAEQVESVLETDEAATLLRDAVLPATVEPERVRRLRVAGLVWSPPETLHHYLTAIGARVLVEQEEFCSRRELDAGRRAGLRARARANPLLGSWIMRLTGLVELEMLTHAKSAADIDEVLGRSELEASLQQRRRSSEGEEFYGGSPAPIDHTSFGELKYLLFDSEASERFPLSRRRTGEIQRIRNLVAHHHFVGWRGVRKVLGALAALKGA